MEKTAQAFARNHPKSRTTVSVTRYGNVMYSRGSVIPLFVKQLQVGQPLTVTEPRMTRFLMSLQESVASSSTPSPMPSQATCSSVRRLPPRSSVLAEAVASLFGVDDPEITTIGTRHGEKLHETLLSREEMVKAGDEGDYFRVPLDARSLQYELYYEEGDRGTAVAATTTPPRTPSGLMSTEPRSSCSACPRSANC